MKYQINHLKSKLAQKIAQLLAIRLSFIPHKDIKKLPKKDFGFSWFSSSEDPQFLLKPKNRFMPNKLTAGWYLLQVELTHEMNNYQLGKLYLNSDNSLQEENTLQFHLRPNKRTTRFFYIPKTVRNIRFDPTETIGEFGFQRIMLIRIPKFYAYRRMIKKIQALHPLFKNMPIQELKKRIGKTASKEQQSFEASITKLYSETFPVYEAERSYTQWIEAIEKPLIKKNVQNVNVNKKPLISILLPTYNSNIKFLEECLKSVKQQTYSNWQLCIVDDASTQKNHLPLIQKSMQQDKRIQFLQRKTNGHISASSNDALSLANGEYTLLLDHDDTLSPEALTLLVNELNQNPKAKLIYADEDKIDEYGNRFMPHFKPDWNPDLLYSQNYICHPVLYKTDELKKIKGFRLGVEGSQDHDLLLRYTQNLCQEEISHLPYILYHWRSFKGSTSGDSDAKTYTSKAGIKSLQDFFDSTNKKTQVIQGKYPNTYHCKWPIPKIQPLVSLLIPTRDGYDILKNCIESIIEKTDYNNFEIIILNNQSKCEKTIEYFSELQKKYNNIRVLDWNNPFNYSAINNYGVEHAYGEIIGLVNNDIEVISPQWLTEMVSHSIRPEIGCVGAKLYYSNDTIQHAGVILGLGGVAGHAHKYFSKEDPGYFSRLQLTQNLSAVTAACLLVRKSIYDEVNGLDEKNLTVAFNDVDFCLKVQEAGYRNLFTPWAELYHHESISRGQEDTPQKQKRALGEIIHMKNKWGTLLNQDPAYNQNLTLTYENFSLR